jgi:cell wall-associated NlpC family hydrolase
MRRGARLAGIGIAVTALVVGAVPAAADEVADLQQRAAQIVAQQAQLEEQSSTLTDQLNGARVELDRVQAKVAEVQGRLDEQQSSLVGLNAQLTQFAIKSYVYGDTQGGITNLLAGETPGQDVATRQGYTELIFGENRDIVDTVKAKRVETDRERAELQTALGRQQVLLANIERYRTQVETTQATLVSLLAQVQGDLAQAVAEAEQRRIAEEARRAREAAARQAAEFARQQAEQQRRAASSAATTTTVAPTAPATTRPGQPTTTTRATTAPTTRATTPPTTPPTTRPPVNYPAPNPGAARAVQSALAQVGKPYRYATADPAVGFDCSGLTSWSWAQSGVYLPHYSKAQWQSLPAVPLDALQPGDLVFFYYPAVSHVGLYIGGGQMVDAQGPGYTVRVTQIYGRGLFAAGRPG